MCRIERSHVLIVGPVEFIVAATQFRDVDAAGVFCASDVSEPVDKVMPPVPSQFIVRSVCVGAGRLPGLEVSDDVRAFGDGLCRVELCLQSRLEIVRRAGSIVEIRL